MGQGKPPGPFSDEMTSGSAWPRGGEDAYKPVDAPTRAAPQLQSVRRRWLPKPLSPLASEHALPQCVAATLWATGYGGGCG